MKKVFKPLFDYLSRPFGWQIDIKPHTPTHTFDFFRPSESQRFFDAIKERNNEALENMIDSSPDLIEMRDDRELTPLMQAAAARNKEAVALLLTAGADASKQDGDWWTAMTWAVFVQDREIQKMISRYSSVLVNSPDVSGGLLGVATIR